MKKILLSPSILAANHLNFAKNIAHCERNKIDWIHIDVMDGHFVPNLTFGPHMVKALRSVTSLPLDVHLMLENPGQYINQFAEAGADFITIHVESKGRTINIIKKIRKLHICPGIVINPDTPAEKIKKYLPYVDLVLVMSVYPGFSYQSFMPEVLVKIEKISQWIKREKRKTYLQVDGGINEKTAPLVVAAGADVLVAGGAIFNKKYTIQQAVKRLRNAIEN